jgi:phosphatidylglycerol:prolipoprotein diacylglycerol transferase
VRPTLQAFLAEHGLSVLAWLVPTPGVAYAAMFLALVGLFVHRMRAVGVPFARTLDAVVAAAAGALVGTRLYWLILSGDVLRLNPLEWVTSTRGTASWGAYVGVTLALLLYLRVTRQRPWPHLDAAASCAPLGTVVGRLACFLEGDDFGRLSSLPWAVTFPRGSLAFYAHLRGELIPHGSEQSLPVHPLQLYLSANAAVVFLIVSAVWRRSHDRPGRAVAAYFLAYGATRFLWEFLRDPAAGGATGGLSTSQWMCLTFVAAGTVLQWWTSRAPSSARPAAATSPS